MSDYLDVRMVRSRGRVRCDRCGRRIPKGTRYEQYDYVDGGVYHSRTCPTCLDIGAYVTEEMDPDMPWGPDESWEWARDVMGWLSGWSDSLLGDDDPSLADIALRTLNKDAEKANALDTDPTWAWGEEAWAAFTWRMQISPCITGTKGHNDSRPSHASHATHELESSVDPTSE